MDNLITVDGSGFFHVAFHVIVFPLPFQSFELIKSSPLSIAEREISPYSREGRRNLWSTFAFINPFGLHHRSVSDNYGTFLIELRSSK